MSRVEEERQAQLHEQKLKNEKTAKEKAAAAAKFGQVITQSKNQQSQMHTQSALKQQQQKQHADQRQSQQMLLGKQGILRGSTEGLLKARDEERKIKDDKRKDRDEDIKKEDDKSDQIQTTQRDDLVNQQAIQRKDEQPQGQSQNQSQQQSSGGGQQHSSGGQEQQQNQKHEKESGMGIAGVAKKQTASVDEEGGIESATAAQSGGKKMAIGKSLQAEAAERIDPRALSAVADKVYQYISKENMKEFQIELKDDMLGGGALRVSLKDSGLKLTFQMKEHYASNLIESSKQQLFRAFEKKGFKQIEIEVKRKA